MFIILGRLKTEQGKFEAVLTAGFTVATTGIATGFGENRHDLVGEVDGRNIFELFDRNLECSSRRKEALIFLFGIRLSLLTSAATSFGVRGSYLRGDRGCSFGQRRDA